MILHLLLGLALMGLPAQGKELLAGFRAIKKEPLAQAYINTEQIIFATDHHYLIKNPLTNFVSFDYYYVQIPNLRTQEWISQHSNLTFMEKGYFAVLQINNEKEILEVARKLHNETGQCGMIHKLRETPLRKDISFEYQAKPHQRVIADMLTKVNENNILSTMDTMVSWQSRHHNDPQGVGTGEKLLEIYRHLTPSHRQDVQLELIEHQGTSQKSLLVRIIGQTHPQEILILGSHIDSINSNDTANSPGADDNASGTATNIEVFRVLMENNFKPQRTIEIHGYAAEEVGLVGSGEMAEHYRNQNKDVKAMVQFDMNAYAKNAPKITFVNNGTDSHLTQELMKLVDQYLAVPSTTGFLIFGNSDHASWKKHGFPVAFPTEDPFNFNRHIHTKNDTMAHINSPEQIREFAKLGVAYLMEFAGF